ncbi:MAG TPA: hypothetical protein VKB63_05575 [Gemmatimonadales bacterium]|nr:hypothetical protein [Gemmatimonadales bacterium]
MHVTRRQFLECTAAAAVPLRWRLGGPPLPVTARLDKVILDLGVNCSLRESVSGYAAVLGAAALRTDMSSMQPPDVLIVPAVLEIPSRAIQAMIACLDSGGLVILESGAGFASAADFSRHRTLLREALEVHVEPLVDLWSQSGGSAIPYIDFTWPCKVKIRDFSRVVPLTGEAGEIIAQVNGLPAALRRRSDRGTLIVLGSPLGPVLWTGDHEARQWLRVVIEATPGWG